MKYLKLLPAVVFFLIAGPVFAKTATPSATPAISATPSATSDSTVQNNLETRFKNIVQQNLSTTEAELQAKINQQSIVGYAGKVTSISNNSISFDSSGEIFQVATFDNTVIVNANQKVKLSSIAIGDKLIVIGTLNSKNNLLDAKRIVIVKTPDSTDRPTVYVGKISTPDTKKGTLSFQTAQSTIKMILSKKANLKITDLKDGANAVVIVRTQDAGLVITKIKIL